MEFTSLANLVNEQRSSIGIIYEQKYHTWTKSVINL